MRIIKVKFNRPQKFLTVPKFVYCGRPYGGFDGSFLANPFRVTLDWPLVDVLETYRDHLETAVRRGGAIAVALAELSSDSVLGCWCLDKEVAGTEPLQCHCDVIAQVWQKHFGQHS
jgi:hypothetical protein